MALTTFDKIVFWERVETTADEKRWKRAAPSRSGGGRERAGKAEDRNCPAAASHRTQNNSSAVTNTVTNRSFRRV